MKTVYPGYHLKDFREKPSLKIGAYLLKSDSTRQLRSAVIGAYKPGSDSVIPIRGPYIPRLNDDVVGIIVSEEPSYLRVDIRSPYSAHFRPGPDEEYSVGDVIRAKVVEFDLKRSPVLSTRRFSEKELYGRIESGIIVEFSPNRIGAVLGPRLSYLNKIQESLNVTIYPGRNGRFVISGENARLVAEFLREVDEAPATRVTEVVREFLKKLGRTPALVGSGTPRRKLSRTSA